MLTKISESALLRKLWLSKRFSGKTLCAQESQISSRIIKPSIVIIALSLKLCLGHERKVDRIVERIDMNKNTTLFKYGHNKNNMSMPRRDKV